MGLAGCKLKVGGRRPAQDAERVVAARAAAGEDFVLAIDANQGYTVAQAFDLAGRVAGGGEVALPHGPGLGWELDRGYIERYGLDRS